MNNKQQLCTCSTHVIMPSGYLYEARTFKIADLKTVGRSLVGSLVATGFSGPLERVHSPLHYFRFDRV